MLVVLCAAMALSVGVTVAGAASVTLDGSFSQVIQKPNFVGQCPSGVADECGTIQLAGLGAADWAYTFGPTFESDGRCYDVDGSLTITLHSNGSTISGPLTGLFCPRPSFTGHQHGGAVSFGNPFIEDDTVLFTNGTGQFAGLTGTAMFHTMSAGALLKGKLRGTLS
jgi:hypothetical protein